MNNKTVRVLEVNINDVGQGGAWAFIKNAINAKENNKTGNIIFDFFSLEPFENRNNIEFVENIGGKIIVSYTSNKIWRQIKTYFDLKLVLKETKYDIVHIHSDVSFKMFLEGIAARNVGITHIILHSHCAGIDRGHRNIKRIAHYLCKPFLGYLGTAFFACSKKAGKWMYTKNVNKKVKIINNAVDCKAFSYNESVRAECRAEFGINKNEILIGHVGRFMFQKNHEYLIKIFHELYKKKNNVKLLLIGEGELEDFIRKQVHELGLEKVVIFAGVRRDINRCMQAMDLFLLPSKFEGLPIVGIEAQASGLPCLLSNSITKETDLFGLVEFFPLSNSPDKWSNKIIEMVKKINRRDTYIEMKNAGYDISVNKESLKDIYFALR